MKRYDLVLFQTSNSEIVMNLIFLAIFDMFIQTILFIELWREKKFDVFSKNKSI